MILRNIKWIHSLIRVEVIERCCSIHVFRNSLILILYNIIIFTYSNIIFTYSNIHCLITLICLIILISHIVNFFLYASFIFCVQVRIFPLNMCDIIIYVAQWWEKYLQKRSLIKHTCSWRDKLIILWTLKRQAKIFFTYITYSTFSKGSMKKTRNHSRSSK